MKETVFYDDEEPKATFIISIMYRHNSTWQGRMRWLENKKETPFKSTLELVRMMDDAIKKKQNSLQSAENNSTMSDSEEYMKGEIYAD